MKNRKKTMWISVLGEKYHITTRSEQDDAVLEDADGYCDSSIKTIVVRDLSTFKNNPDALKDLDTCVDKVIRHEIIHAFLDESGLRNESWARNEEMVDWFAIQFPKLQKAFDSALPTSENSAEKQKEA